MAVVCPICKSSAQELPAGEATAFHCPTHGDFKVAETVFAEAKAKAKAKAKDYTRDQWEARSKPSRPSIGWRSVTYLVEMTP
jgi:predicted RNA-binding Zn-ribbon protein involved in translation (DUF1610 family)